jgi:hypothetical protein
MQARARLDARERAGADEPHQMLCVLDVNADVGLIAIVDDIERESSSGVIASPSPSSQSRKHLQTAGALLVVRGRKLPCQCKPSWTRARTGVDVTSVVIMGQVITNPA